MASVIRLCPFCQSRRVVVTAASIRLREMKCEECSRQWSETTGAAVAVTPAERRPARWSPA
jgi:transposase-like protein